MLDSDSRKVLKRILSLENKDHSYSISELRLSLKNADELRIFEIIDYLKDEKYLDYTYLGKGSMSIFPTQKGRAYTKVKRRYDLVYSVLLPAFVAIISGVVVFYLCSLFS